MNINALMRLTVFFLLTSLVCQAQINYSANTLGKVVPYTGYYNYGSNLGYYDQTWDDKTLADIAAGNPAYGVAGVGVKTFRALLNERFLASNDPALGSDAYGWGYNIRVPEFQHYAALGMKDHVIFLAVNVLNADRKDYIRPDHVDNTTYPGCSEKSKIFKNIYEPIWDGGANGTPVNDNNYFALFVYNTVQTYKPYAKFWEIGNEPDYTGSVGSFAQPGQPGNWWDNPPAACDLTNLKAPVFSYIRMLRIAYEVIKYTDPNAYVGTGGIGYPSFLDNLLRYTDNPDGGKVTADYPLKGGAFFDVLSFHEYPQYALSDYVNGGRVYKRHSDAAVAAVAGKKNDLQTVLYKYGYNGNPYPEKNWILTEVNIPRKQYAGSNDIGSDEAQRNFIAKCLVVAQKQAIKQVHIFSLGESTDPASSQYPGTDLMGLHYDLHNKGPLVYDPTTGGNRNSGSYRQQVNQTGIAYKTVSDALFGYSYDAARTAALNLPASVEGAAFQNQAGKYVYGLWAKTTTDQSETASATYSFPTGLGIPASLDRKEWNYSQTGTLTAVGSQNIPLTGSPVFLTGNATTDTQAPTTPTNLASSNITSTGFTLSWTASTDNVGITGYDIYKDGLLYSSATATSATITGLSASTTYSFTVKAKDAAGNVSSASTTLSVSTPAAADTQAPTTPANLASSNVTSTGFTLSWTASTDNVGVTGYDVFQNSTKINTADVTSTSFAVTGLSASTTYSFTVKAKDAAGNVSPASTALSVTTSGGGGAPSLEAGWLLNFGWQYSTPVANYNNLFPAAFPLPNGTAYNNLKRSDGSTSATGFVLTSAISGGGNAGGCSSGAYATAALNSWWRVQNGEVFSAKFTGLNPAKSYNLIFLQSSGSNTALAIYTINGVSKSLAGQNNCTGTATFTDIIPNASGEIAFSLSRNSGYYEAGINVLELQQFGSTATDTQAPTTPTNLASTNVTTTGFTLSWTASTDNVGVTGYDIYKDGLLYSSATATSAIITGLSASTTYSFTVKAKDAAGNMSPASTALSVSTPATADTQAPTAPTNLASSNVTSTSFTLSWTASTDNVGVIGYDVFQNSTKINTADVTSTSFAVTGLSASTTYSFTVKAKDAAGNVSPASTALSVTTSGGGGAPSLEAGWLLNFGWQYSTPVANYNNLFPAAFPLPTGTAYSLIRDNGAASAVQFVITQPVTGGGSSSGNCTGITPYDAAARNSWWRVQNNQVMAFKFTGLSTAKAYSLILFHNSGNNTALATYTANGTSQTLSGQNNCNNTVRFDNLIPNAAGEISLSVSRSSGYYEAGLNLLELRQYSSVGLRTAQVSVKAEAVESEKEDFRFAPNPTDGSVSATYFASAPGSLSIRISNAIGQVVMTRQQSLATGSNQVALDLGRQSAGLYYIEIIHDGKRLIRKVILAR